MHIHSMRNAIRYTPRTDLNSLQREFDSLFNRFFPSWNGSEEEWSSSSTWAPSVDLGENEDRYLVRLDVPGMTKADIDIRVNNGVLTVAGERKAEDTSDVDTFFRRETYYGRFQRSFRLPQEVQTDQIRAEYTDGVLKVEIPKAEERKPRQIAIS